LGCSAIGWMEYIWLDTLAWGGRLPLAMTVPSQDNTTERTRAHVRATNGIRTHIPCVPVTSVCAVTVRPALSVPLYYGCSKLNIPIRVYVVESASV
jgi:hypothetical protein